MAQQSNTRTVLNIKTPKNVQNSLKKFLSFFTDLHKFIGGTSGLQESEKVVTFELLLKEGHFSYRIVLSDKLASVTKSLLYTKFSDIEINQSNTIERLKGQHASVLEFGLKRSNLLPLKTEFDDEDDPYKIFAAVLSKLKHFEEGIVIQLTIKPYSESWFSQYLRERFAFLIGPLNSIMLFVEEPFLERENIDVNKEIRNKYGAKLFDANLRVLAYSISQDELSETTSLAIKALDKLSNGDINELRSIKTTKQETMLHYSRRSMSRTTMRLNAKELSAIHHFPDETIHIKEVESIDSKKIKAPKTLPHASYLASPNVSVFAKTNYREQDLEFGLKRQDRNRHLYVIGKTGMGKSKLIQLLAVSDIINGKGVCIIDPHGDLAADILSQVPKERIKDVIYFNPLDKEYPVGFNPLQCYSPEAKHQVVEGFIAIFEKLFAATWTNRLEHMLRFTVLALVESGDATVVDIVKLLTNTEFRQAVIKKIKDPVVKNFWTQEFSSWNEKFDNEAIIPIINQVGQFIANDYIRNVVEQKKSAFDFYSAMNEEKIVVINIAKGILGEENAALLGSMIITKIQEATMARVNMPQSERKEFYLYVDEFQNFATESFNQILSEARKFNLSLTIAHQYIDQLSESIRRTVFGNIGSLISFRVGPEDAQYLKNEFAPHITPDDLINLDFREVYAKLSIDGKTSEPFSATTIDIPSIQDDHTKDIVQYTREHFAHQKKTFDEPENQIHRKREAVSVEEIDEAEDFEHLEFEEPLL